MDFPTKKQKPKGTIKGSKNRVKDLKTYRDEMDRIFNKKEQKHERSKTS